MKFFFDLLPVLLFFVAFKVAGIFAATAVAIAVSVAQIAWLKLRGKPVDNVQWASLAIIVVFGGMTLWLKDPTFIKLKPTVLYGAFALGLAVSRLAFGRNLIRSMMGKQVRLPDPIWERLNVAWIVFFVGLAVLNVVIAYNFSEEFWVNFKLFGSLGLTVLFVVGQALWFSRHVQEDA
ncbi:MAG: intracellular septation protein [Pseudomonadota bacterium]